MSALGLDNGFRSILPMDMGTEFIARVSCISHHEIRMELGCSVSGLSQNARGTSGVMHISSRYAESNGQFVLRIHDKVNLVSKPELLEIARGALDGPSSILIRSRFLGLVRPCLYICRVYSDAFPEAWKCPVALSNHLLHCVLYEAPVFPLREFCHETRERRLGWDLLRRFYATSPSNEWVIFQESYECGYRGQTQYIADKVAAPEYLGLIAWPTSSPCTCESIEKVFIWQCFEECLKLMDNWREELNIACTYCIIEKCHREARPFLVAEAVGVSAPAASSIT